MEFHKIDPWSMRRVVDKMAMMRMSAGILSPTVKWNENKASAFYIYICLSWWRGKA
jgi:hypothetical protein